VGVDAVASKGVQLYVLAEKRSKNFGICIEKGDDGEFTSGEAAVNKLSLEQFEIGQTQFNEGKCDEARPTVKRVEQLMAVPLLQGILRQRRHGW